MKELNLHEEIIKSLKLIRYDRSLTLNEQMSIDDPEFYRSNTNSLKQKGYQTYKSDNLLEPDTIVQKEPNKEIKRKREERQKKEKIQKYIQKKIKQNCSSLIKAKPKDYADKKAKEIFKVLQTNFENKGTKENDILNAIYKIDSKYVYAAVLRYFIGCFGGTTILSGIQNMEYSKGGQYVPSRYSKESVKMNKNAESLRGFIGVNEDTLQESGPNLFNIVGSPRMGDVVQWNRNDKWLFLMQKHLTKYNPLEIYEKEKPQNIVQTFIPPFTREALHVFLPIVSFILMVAPGTQGVSAALMTLVPELIDSGIYYFADKDPYMAGLTIIFAFLTVAEEFAIARKLQNIDQFKLMEKIYNKKLWQMSERELSILTDILSDPKKWIRVARRKSLQRSVKKLSEYVFGRNNPRLTVTFINWLVEKGFLLSSALSRFTITVGGATLTWDAIAKIVFSIDCRNFSWQELFNEFGLKFIGKGASYSQPFTKQNNEENKKYCQRELQKNFEYEYKKITKEKNTIPIKIFEKMVKNNLSFSTNDYNDFNTEVVWVQLFLTEFLKKTNIKSNEIPPEFEKTSPQGVRNFAYNPKYDYLYKPENKSQLDDMRNRHKKSEIFKKKKSPITFKWGSFGNNTKSAVQIYQKYNKLNITGSVDLETLKKMFSDIKSSKYGEIKNISGINLDADTENILKQKVYDDMVNQNVEKYKKDKKLVEQKVLELHPEMKEVVDKYENINNSDTEVEDGKKAIEEFKKNHPELFL